MASPASSVKIDYKQADGSKPFVRLACAEAPDSRTPLSRCEMQRPANSNSDQSWLTRMMRSVSEAAAPMAENIVCRLKRFFVTVSRNSISPSCSEG